MKKFYYQLKCKEKDEYTGLIQSYWSSAFFKGIVEAEDTKSARKYIKETILEKELRKDENILLSIIEVKQDTPYLLEMFEPKTCAYCGNTYTFANNEYYGQYCCRSCYEQAKLQQRKDDNEVFFSSDWSESYPVIYRIYDKKNNKNYIGQTIRAFTLRWWEHYKNWIQMVENTDITDFEFTVLKQFQKCVTKEELSQAEQFYIEKYDAINNGYNGRNEVSNAKSERRTNK